MATVTFIQAFQVSLLALLTEPVILLQCPHQQYHAQKHTLQPALKGPAGTLPEESVCPGQAPISAGQRCLDVLIGGKVSQITQSGHSRLPSEHLGSNPLDIFGLHVAYNREQEAVRKRAESPSLSRAVCALHPQRQAKEPRSTTSPQLGVEVGAAEGSRNSAIAGPTRSESERSQNKFPLSGELQWLKTSF